MDENPAFLSLLMSWPLQSAERVVQVLLSNWMCLHTQSSSCAEEADGCYVHDATLEHGARIHISESQRGIYGWSIVLRRTDAEQQESDGKNISWA